MTTEPRLIIAQLETAAPLPRASGEQFDGFGVMGLPFASGHVLAMRRFPHSSIGPGYSSVWHRTPAGAWTFYADAAPRQSCSRFFGKSVTATVETPIELTWPGAASFRVAIPAADFEWELELEATPATRLMNVMGRLLPEGAWGSPAVLALMNLLAGPLLRAGRMALAGRVPNGQQFAVNPRLLWAIASSRARLAGDDFGPPGPIHPQPRLGDLWIPQRGILAIGQVHFESYDAARHSSETCGLADADRV